MWSPDKSPKLVYEPGMNTVPYTVDANLYMMTQLMSIVGMPEDQISKQRVVFHPKENGITLGAANRKTKEIHLFPSRVFRKQKSYNAGISMSSTLCHETRHIVDYSNKDLLKQNSNTELICTISPSFLITFATLLPLTFAHVPEPVAYAAGFIASVVTARIARSTIFYHYSPLEINARVAEKDLWRNHPILLNSIKLVDRQ